MTKAGQEKARGSTAPNFQSLAEELASVAPPLTADQLDALGRIVGSAPPGPEPELKPAPAARRRQPKQLALPYDQIDPKSPRVVVHGRKVIRVVEEHPIAETG